MGQKVISSGDNKRGLDVAQVEEYQDVQCLVNAAGTSVVMKIHQGILHMYLLCYVQEDGHREQRERAREILVRRCCIDRPIAVSRS